MGTVLKHWLLLLAVFPALVLASSATLPNTTSIGYPYYFDASIDGVSFRIPCALTAFDRFNTLSKAWTTDGAGFPLTTDRNGSVNSFVYIDNSFANDETYLFQLQCGRFSSFQNVTIAIGGSNTINLAFLNTLSWFNERPNESILTIIVVISGLILLAAAFVVFRKKTKW
jgi:hypothetical protein